MHHFPISLMLRVWRLPTPWGIPSRPLIFLGTVPSTILARAMRPQVISMGLPAAILIFGTANPERAFRPWNLRTLSRDAHELMLFPTYLVRL